MSGFLYGIVLQWKLDIRSKSLLITCYVVPLLFFAVMGGIFTSIDPHSKGTIIQSMTVMGVSMCALIGLPPSLLEIYRSDIKKMYKANGVPIYLGLVTIFLSAFIHLFIMSAIIYMSAPIIFGAAPPKNLPLYFGLLAIFIVVSLSIGSVLGLWVKNQSKLTMISQLVFLPSIMLSGIMFPVDLLPNIFKLIGKIFPSTWGYQLMTNTPFDASGLWPLLAISLICAILCVNALTRLGSE